MLTTLFRAASFSLRAVSETFAPQVGATSRQVRVNGAICIAAAFLTIVLAFGLILLLGSATAPAILALPAMFMYASLVVGGYRLVFGASPKSEDGPLRSLARVAFGVAWIVLIMGSLIGAQILFHL